MKPPMLSIQQVAERLNVSDDKVRRLIVGRQLPAVRIGHWRIEPADLDAFIAAQRTSPDDAPPNHRSELPPLERNPFL